MSAPRPETIGCEVARVVRAQVEDGLADRAQRAGQLGAGRVSGAGGVGTSSA
jgi:hypothetical protein